MAPRKIIIDTDPGVDDVLAMLLALSALPEELEVLLISVTYGNIDVDNALRNVISLFYQIEKEIEWRKSQPGHKLGFDTLRKSKPIVAVGPSGPLADQLMLADYFHGPDGLADIHKTHPQFTPAETWKHLFSSAQNSSDPAQATVAEELKKTETLFTPSRHSGAHEILRLLRENEPDTITIVAVGPLTNLAIAAAEDPETFLRVKEVVVMGGTIERSGNVTPVAEFNTFADAFAAARVYALTSPRPHGTMPTFPPPPSSKTLSPVPAPPTSSLPDYPKTLSRRLKVTLFPLDITEQHLLTRGEFNSILAPLLASQSPLAQWTGTFMEYMYAKMESLSSAATGDAVGFQLHDPLCVWYCMFDQTSITTITTNTSTAPSTPQWKIIKDIDLRVEPAGQWTRGMCVVDRRNRIHLDDTTGADVLIEGDQGTWLHAGYGNRIDRCVESPDKLGFGRFMIERILGL